MSSSNLVSVVYAPETVYGVTDTPLSGDTYYTAVFTSESLTGTPATTESEEIRTDRLSGGQVVTGLSVEGGLDFELKPDRFHDDFLEAGMMTNWVLAGSSAETVDLTPDPADNQKATLTIGGDFSTIGGGIVANDIIQLVPGTGSPIVLSVISVDSTTELTVATMRGEPAIVAGAYSVLRPQYLDIGAVKRSFVIGKAYKDVLVSPGNVDEYSQTYNGELVSGFSLSMTTGEIVNGSYTLLGNGYTQTTPSLEQQVVAAGGTVTPAGTANPLNASVDVPVVTARGEATSWCMQSLTLELDNGLDPQTCIGKIAPTDFALGQAQVSISASIYLSETSYLDFMPAKLSQEPVSISVSTLNADGGYAFVLSAVQLTFPDPSSQGRNQQTTIEASGVAKVGDGGESSLRIYKLVGDQ